MDEVLDEKYMARAIELDKRGTGGVNPNPLVGEVVVKMVKLLVRVGIKNLVDLMQKFGL